MINTLFPKDTVFSVTNLTTHIKEILEGTFNNITIEGEISGFRPNASGHLYFTLKDDGAQISAVMFKGKAYGLGFAPKDGLKVRCTGSVSVYAPRGNYQIIINKMEIAGQGNILQILEERKRRLAAEGLFDQSRKKKIPAYPKTIGIVTSPTGAALRDILQITKRRNSSVDVIIFPAIVQGDSASPTIVQQIKTANIYKMCDVLIVGRGGGSLEDLLPFSEESVVRAVSDSQIPVVSAVGHEIDWSLCDYAADMRAPTPSAAAELVVPKQEDIILSISNMTEDLYDTMQDKIDRLKLMIKMFDINNMEIKFRNIEQPLLNRLDNAKEALLNGMHQKTKDTKAFIEKCISILDAASPKTILSKGYSMVKVAGTQTIIHSSNQVSKGQKLEIVPAEGIINATVD